MRKLVQGLRFLGSWADVWRVPTTSAFSQARQRLGEEPLAELFHRVARPMAAVGTRGTWYGDWRVMAIDGVVLDVPDTPENRERFGKSRNAQAESPFPQVRIVGLAECGTHAIVGAAFDTCRTMERDLALRLLDDVEPGQLVLADRGFYSYDFFSTVRATGADLLWRVSSRLELPALEWLPDGSYRSEVGPNKWKVDAKRGKRRRVSDELLLPVRVITYQVTNRGDEPETIRLITTLDDHEQAPAIELAALYQQRWEFELTLDEVETHQMPSSRVLRSRTPELVRQEIWALLLTHYAVRAFMRDAADDPDDPLDVDQLSFLRSLRVIRRQVTNQAGFSPSTPEPSDPGNPHRDP